MGSCGLAFDNLLSVDLATSDDRSLTARTPRTRISSGRAGGRRKSRHCNVVRLCSVGPVPGILVHLLDRTHRFCAGGRDTFRWRRPWVQPQAPKESENRRLDCRPIRLPSISPGSPGQIAGMFHAMATGSPTASEPVGIQPLLLCMSSHSIDCRKHQQSPSSPSVPGSHPARWNTALASLFPEARRVQPRTP
jgi:hypothetical protein